MHRWMAAFPNPTNTDRDEDEVIYEDWGENTHARSTQSDSTARGCVRFISIVSDGYVFARQTVLRCSVWSSTLPSSQTSSPWSPLRLSTSSAKPMRVRTRREPRTIELLFIRLDDHIQDCKHFLFQKTIL